MQHFISKVKSYTQENNIAEAPILYPLIGIFQKITTLTSQQYIFLNHFLTISLISLKATGVVTYIPNLHVILSI